MSNFKELGVFWDAHRLTLEVYRICRGFPPIERYGLAAQMRRAAGSIPTNLAEGSGRSTPADFARFVDVASGSLHELEYQIMLAHDLGYLSGGQYTDIDGRVSAVGRQLNGLRRALRR